MEKIDQVTIIGGGTAGLILAGKLAADGVEVGVYEQSRMPGFPVKASTILSKAGISALGIDARIAKGSLSGAIIHFGNGKLVVKSERTVAYIFERPDLNKMLSEKAKEYGVKMHVGKRVGENLLSKIRGKTIIVGADGFPSTVAKYFSFPPIDNYILTYRAEYAIACKNEHVVELFFDNKITPGMFGWISPIGKGSLEIGVGIKGGFGNSRRAFEQFIGTVGVREVVGDSKPLNEAASIIPIDVRKRIVDDKSKVLLVGDAAGQVKKTTGGGIIFGGNGAMLAAIAIEDFLKGKGMLNDYEKAWRRKFRFDDMLHGAIRKVYSSLSTTQLELLAKATRALGIEGFLSKYGDMDRPSLMLKRYFVRR